MIQSALIKKQRRILVILLILIMATIVIGMGTGYSSLSYDRLIPVLFGQGTFKEEFILFSIRLPRIVITLLAGMALALSGAILQGITRNDLADPGILGINSGAGVGVAVFFLFFPIQSNSFAYLIPLIAFISALLTACFIYLLSYNRNAGFQPVRLVLIGVGFSMALSGAMIVLISSAERTKVDFIAKWLAGNIWGDDWPFILAILPWLIVLIPLTLYKANRLNILELNEPMAIGVGLEIQKERILLMITAVALAAAAVSVTGGIAFIGLMAPHIAKALIGPRNQLFIPIAILMGGWLLLFADTIGRNIADGIPTGIIVSLIGAPYFIYLLLRK
ncbi:FecCD family ABC transporter permease [Parageobacillus thermoglucosidasius]|uniref:Iron ABC transporter permease n=2 Tax=Anoxybacillaceae TaxID=3120669 RepID=A0AB38QXV9_PARTM|nr:iron ABC transporter permease [Parageobacillus thermoglucosidasius]AEH46261.1 ABC-type transporter, integral membrane subunit [Parageobacillus thermoglucosidasius C56-YS93]UOE76203.1 iron ABC transporter permease [Parageobacillus thermoglucosidasius]GCD80987.1 iron ABC transporter permease [Parageobacillus thermoglucosidasius]GMO00146.1 iron ABC transporter permease [Parageobacillus thermoglucosidasius]